jgi:hypothetical protein
MNPAAFLALVALHQPASHDGRPVETCPAHVVAEFNEMDDALRHLREQLEHVKKNGQREHLQEDLDAAFAASQRARITACRAARGGQVVVVEQPPPPPPPAPRILSDNAHHDLTHAVRREAWDDARLGVMTMGVTGVCVTSEQARDLVREMTFTRGRLDALRMLAPRIVDKERAYFIFEALTFESDKRAAREILSTTPQALECVPPRRV